MTKNSTNWKFSTNLLPTQQDTRTVIAARAEVSQQLKAGEQVICPLSGRVLQVYDRSITAAMVEVLAAIYHLTRHSTNTWVGAKELATRGGDYGKLRHWGLISRKENADGSRSAKWRITSSGCLFVEGAVRVPRKVLVYNDRCVGQVGGDTVGFEDLMGGLSLAEVLKRKAGHGPLAGAAE